MIKPFAYAERILVSGHRGIGIGGYENTMTAFREAVACGVDMIETDVHRTVDGALILMHDAAVDRTTDGHGLITEMTLAEVRACNAAAHAQRVMPPEPVPLLSELLNLAAEHPRLLLNIELKDYTYEQGEDWAIETARQTAEMILARGLAARTWINSFEGRLLAYVYEHYGNAFRYHGFYPWFILGEMDIDPESFIDMACMQHRYQLPDGTIRKYEDPLCPKEWFEYLKERGIMPALAPSLRDLKKFDLGFSYGSRIATPDDPAGMIAHLRAAGLRR